MSRLALCAVFVVFLVGCQVPTSQAPPPPREPLLVKHEVAASDPSDQRVTVLLHGYGSNELDLVGLAPKLGLKGELVSYRAPQTAGRGFAWFPIEFTPDGTRYPQNAADDSLDRLAAELRLLRAERRAPIVVVGFSQGAMMAMLLAAEHPDTVDAAISLSGALPREPHAAQTPSPVFMVHGQADDVVPLARAQRAHGWLVEDGVDVELFEVPGLKHRTSPEGLRRAQDWLAEHCPPPNCGRSGGNGAN